MSSAKRAEYLVRYSVSDDFYPRVGAVDSGGRLRELPFGSLAEVLRLTSAELAAAVVELGPVVTGARPLRPVDGHMEVWASGVTYLRSMDARVEESEVADVYTRVYVAERPELFFKAVPWKVVTDGEPIGIRHDSELNVPEPELAAVANTHGEVIGFTICNDVSSRSIEGANPLYLPQAKVYAASCSLAPAIRLAHTLPDGWSTNIVCTVIRDDRAIWSASTNSDRMHRSPADLVSWLFRQDRYPDGAILATGTGLVPELDVTLADGDVVDITIEDVGRLRNVVRTGLDAAPALTEFASITRGSDENVYQR